MEIFVASSEEEDQAKHPLSLQNAQGTWRKWRLRSQEDAGSRGEQTRCLFVLGGGELGSVEERRWLGVLRKVFQSQ